jgi:hypothetical protein
MAHKSSLGTAMPRITKLQKNAWNAEGSIPAAEIITFPEVDYYKPLKHMPQLRHMPAH